MKAAFNLLFFFLLLVVRTKNPIFSTCLIVSTFSRQSLSLSPHYESHENPDIARLNRATPSTESKFPVPVTFLGIYVRTNEAEEWVVLVDVSELKNFTSSVPRERNFCNETLLSIAKFNNLIPLKALAQY